VTGSPRRPFGAYPDTSPRPVPPPAAPGRPPEVIRDLTGRLLAEGLTTRMFSAACPVAAVLSITAGLTVWCVGARLCWTCDGQTITWPAADTAGAAAELARLAALARPGSQVPARACASESLATGRGDGAGRPPHLPPATAAAPPASPAPGRHAQPGGRTLPC
jgi:hypothetical protein